MLSIDIMPKKVQYKGYYELEYGIFEKPWGMSKDLDTGEKYQFCPIGAIWAYEGYNNQNPSFLFDRFYDDGRREIILRHADYRYAFTDPKSEESGFRAYLIKSGWKWNPEEEIVWKIYPDGSAEYKRNHLPIEIQGQDKNACSNEGQMTRCIGNPPPYTQCFPYKFSPEGLKAFRAVASLYPNGFVDRSRYNEYPVWDHWYFPFEPDDSKNIKAYIRNLHPVDVLTLYYTLLEYNGEEQNVYRNSWIYKTRKYVAAVTPEEFQKNGFWSPYQEMLIRAIWDLRTDLRKVKDPNTGELIDGIIDYKLFTAPARQGNRAMIANAVASIALGVMTLGAGTALKTSITAIDMARSIAATVDQAKKVKAMQDFASKVVIGYNAASDPSNIVNPLPFTERDLSADPTAYDPKPVDDTKVSVGLLAGLVIGGYYLLS